MTMDIQRLRYFLEVARQKSFSRAAEICRVSQPSLSQQVKKLEQEVRGPLFLRNRSGVALSPLGEEFLHYAQAVMASVASAEEFIAESSSQSRRTIRFGAIPTIAPYLVPRIFAALRKREPGVRLELLEARTEAVTAALSEGSIDVALVSPPTEIDAQCDALTLLRDELTLTLPRAHRLARATRITPADLAEEPILLLEDSHCLSRQTAAFCARVGLTPDVSIRGSQIETILRLVETGLGIAFTPRMAMEAAAHPRLVFRTLSRTPCHREIRLVWMRHPVLSGSMKLALKVLCEEFRVRHAGAAAR